MRTKEDVLEAVKTEHMKSECIDGRDFSRLVDFFDPDEWIHFGFNIKDDADVSEVRKHIKEWNRENIVEQMKGDVDFGFEKALNQRGISSELMYEVVKMWLRILDCDLKDSNSYAQYGLPLFKSVALKYGFENQIGDDFGTEDKYASGY